MATSKVLGRKNKLHLFSGKNYEVTEDVRETINAIYHLVDLEDLFCEANSIFVQLLKQ